MNEADKLNRINDLELENSQLKEVLPQAFAALEMLANVVVKQAESDADQSNRRILEPELRMAERSLKWLEQFRQPKAVEEAAQTQPSESVEPT